MMLSFRDHKEVFVLRELFDKTSVRGQSSNQDSKEQASDVYHQDCIPRCKVRKLFEEGGPSNGVRMIEG